MYLGRSNKKVTAKRTAVILMPVLRKAPNVGCKLRLTHHIMKKLTATLVILLKLCLAFSQKGSTSFLNSGSKYYDSTDFSKVDALTSWFYVLTDKNMSYEDPVKPIGQLIFQKDQKTRGIPPNFRFQIFNIQDSAYCFKKSQSVRTLSSCHPPDVAGDIIIVKKFIFLNTNICLKCKNYDNGLDNCRPTINRIFSAVDKSKVTTLEDLVKQFPIKGNIMKLPF